MYQNTARRLAPADPTSADAPCTTGEISAHLVSGFADVAARLLDDAGDRLDDSDRQLLYDLKRSESRYPMVTLARLLKIAAICRSDAHAESPAEVIRGAIVMRRQVRRDPVGTCVAVIEASPSATTATLRLVRDPSAVNRAQCADALRALQVTTRQALDALA